MVRRGVGEKVSFDSLVDCVFGEANWGFGFLEAFLSSIRHFWVNGCGDL